MSFSGCSTSPPGVNQVDGLPPVSNTVAEAIRSSLAPRIYMTFTSETNLLKTYVNDLLDLFMETLIIKKEGEIYESFSSGKFRDA